MTSPEDNKIVETKENVQPEVAVQETPEQINWKKFREEREQQRKAQLDAEAKAIKAQQEAAALKQAMEALVNKPDPQQYQHEETDEDRLQKIIDRKIAEQRKKDDEERYQREQKELNQAYRDFDKVCSTENLDYLEYHYPEVAKAFQHMPDNFDKWSSVYNAVKRFIPNTKPQADEKRIEKNLAKPQAMATGSGQQTGDTAPYILDEAKKKANQLRMQRVMKGL